jgi:tRNA-specific 2-thiouridylase
MEEVFTQKVIEPFVEAYLKGVTPNPCVVCNQVIKFDHLLGRADEEGIAFVATGHYAVIKRPENSPAELWRGADQSKEQSYFLHRLEQRHLLRMVLPLGDLTKKEARQLAVKMKLPTVSEPESQEICFVPGNDYRLFLEKSKGMEIAKRGKIVTKEGEKVGEHLGAYRFTIGQRHGLGIASPEPYYVMEIRPEENEVVVGRKQDLFSKRVEAESFNWLDRKPLERRTKFFAQIRYRHIPGTGWLEGMTPGEVKFEFEEPQWGITPGQALVCYEGEKVIGGGWIRKVQGARSTAQG